MAITKLRTLDEETWGERVRRAYRRARDQRGEGFNYRTVAEQISRVYPTAMSSLVRLEHHEDVPRQPRVRLLAFYALLAYGFDPADFGITAENTPIASVDLRKTRLLLAADINAYSPADLAHVPIRRRAA